MSRQSTDEPTGDGYRTSRRSLLASIAAVGVGTGALGAVASAQEGEEFIPTFALGASNQAWQGVSPQSVAGQQNPTLELVEGQTYRVVWQNLDGRPHAFSIVDEDGLKLNALRVLEVSPETITLFDDPATAAAGNLTWGNASTGRVGFLAVEPDPTQSNATRLGIRDVPVVNASVAGEGPGEIDLALLETSPITFEEGAIQAVEFVADSNMAGYVDTVFPTTAEGGLQVSSG